MSSTIEGHRVAIGVFVSCLLKILTRKAMIAANRDRGLTVHNFAGKFTVTTLLAVLMISGLDLNPGPNSHNGEASMDSACASGGNSRPTEKCTADQSTTVQQILQSIQSVSGSVNRIEERQVIWYNLDCKDIERRR